MYERPRVNVKVEWGSTFTFTRDLPHIVSMLVKRVKIMRQWKATLTYAHKTYVSVEMHLEQNMYHVYSNNKILCFFFRSF